MKIRKANVNDCVACSRMSKVKELANAEGWTPSTHYLKAFIKNNQIFLVAQEEKKVIGYAVGESITGKGVLLHYIVIKSEYRGKNIGSALLQDFEREAAKRGNKWALLYAAAFNKKTCAFYEKKNYKKGSESFEFVKYPLKQKP